MLLNNLAHSSLRKISHNNKQINICNELSEIGRGLKTLN
jgi:hypothetical protein